MIGTLLEIAKAFFGLRTQLSAARAARKTAVADYLQAVGATIEAATASLREGTYPHGKCQELLTHSQHLKATVADLIGEPKATELADQLGQVWQIEQLHGELKGMTPAQREESLAKLAEAAGLLQATSAFVRASA